MSHYKLKLLYIVFIFSSLKSAAQEDTLRKKITLYGFCDYYYSYDFNNPRSKDKPSFIYSHSRHNEFALNNAVLGVKYTDKSIRGAIGLHTGTYVRANYSAEPALLQMVYEASVGFLLAKNLWVDAGIFPSHLGFESALSADNLTLTRSMTAENSPYYESGAKATFTPSSRWLFSAMILNGWQNIQETNSNKALGSQIQFNLNEKLSFNSSTFFGNEKPDTAKQFRAFHDFYMIYKPTGRLKFILGLDNGWEQKLRSTKYNTWYNATFISSFKFSEKFSSAFRLEHFIDRNNTVVTYNYSTGFKNGGMSVNVDCKVAEGLLFRCEGKVYKSRYMMFLNEDRAVNTNFFVTTALTYSF